MKKKIQLTTGLCAAVLALSLATTTFADEHTLPSAEHRDGTSLVPVSTESSELVASPVEESTTNLVTPVDPRISEVRVIHRRRTLKPGFSPVASQQMSSTRQLMPVLLPNMTSLEMDQQRLQTKMEKHGTT